MDVILSSGLIEYSEKIKKKLQNHIFIINFCIKYKKNEKKGIVRCEKITYNKN